LPYNVFRERRTFVLLNKGFAQEKDLNHEKNHLLMRSAAVFIDDRFLPSPW
jgi:hypothetical protein